MKSVGCTLKLSEDKNDPYTHRTCELSIRDGRTWALTKSSSDPRLTLSATAGRWTVNEESAGGKWVLYLFDANSLVIVLELYGLKSDFLDLVGCGNSLSGAGWRQGPPPASDVVYDLWWGCV
jgi:hypothetical protein